MTLSAPLVIGFDYTRSLGPVLGRFMAGLRDRRVLGSRTADGRVHVPPLEYDPQTLAPLTDLVEVAATGTVVSWTWTDRPVEGQPLDRPFAWALILLDGADTPLLHAVDAGSRAAVHTGLRVRVRWAESRTGHIRDIACFEPAPDAPSAPASLDISEKSDMSHGGRDETAGGVSTPPAISEKSEMPSDGQAESAGGRDAADSTEITERSAGELAADGSEDVVEIMTTPIRLAYRHATSQEEDRYLRALAEGRLVGQRCPVCRKVYFPPRVCPADGVAPAEEVTVSDHGTVTTFCVVNVPFAGQRLTPPYVVAYVLLDGADIPMLHLVLGGPAEQVRMGMRVAAVWRDREQWHAHPENIAHFEPTGEPDAPYESYAEHL